MAIVSSGQITITDVNDAVSARLSNEFSGVPTNADGSGGDFTGCSTTITVNQGLQDITANGWSITALPSAGVSGTLVGQTYTVTGLSVDSGYVDLLATHSNGDALSKRFTVTKVKKGEAGALITLVPTSQGFFFKDGVAEPDTQTIGFMAIRQNTEAKVTFEASDGVSLLTDEGYLDAAQYADGIYGQGQGDICYLSVADFGNRKQVTVTAKAGSLASSVTILRLDESSAEPGATRNVFRGALSYGQAYLVGDTVISDGYGWSCIQAHFSEAANRPPPYPATENTWWALASVKGADTLNAVLSNEAFVFPSGSDGAVSSYTGSGTAVRVYEGAEELSYDGVGTSAGTWKVTTAPTNITVGSLTDSGTYLTVGQHSGVANGTDTASITYTITGKTKAGADFTLMKVQTFAKSKQGEMGLDGEGGVYSLQKKFYVAYPTAPYLTVTNASTSSVVGATRVTHSAPGQLVFTGPGTQGHTIVISNVVCGVLAIRARFISGSGNFVGSVNVRQVARTGQYTYQDFYTSATFSTPADTNNWFTVFVDLTKQTSWQYNLPVKEINIVLFNGANDTYDVEYLGFCGAQPASAGAPPGTYVGDTPAETVVSKANGGLQKAGDAITGPVTFATNGGILAATDADNGVFMGPNGLVGKKAGVTTFILDAQGQMGIASATSGARMEMQPNVIKVFDAGGNLRVKIGDLSA